MSEKNPMLSAAQALEHLLAAAVPVQEHEELATQNANGRVLATDLVSPLNVPPMDNTQMDGYAVRASDCVGGSAQLVVSQRIPAGVVGAPLQPGTAARIFTGAMIPHGADAVVMQEQCEALEINGVPHVVVKHQPEPGEWIRRSGEDIQTGSTILRAGTRLRAQELGLAASVGSAQLPVMRRLRVAIFFTGDELALPGQALRPGAIYNSNRYTLRGMLENLGCVISDLGIVPDQLDATRAALRQAAQEHDLIITSGGVSVGDEDHVKPAVEAEGQLNLWQIAIKPGKPLAFGSIANKEAGGKQTFFVGLPGNPVSSMVTFLLFVRPFILRLQGVQGSVQPQAYHLRADFNWSKADRRNEFLRVKINAEGGLELFANQGSGVLSSLVWGDGLVDNPPGQTIARGDLVRFLPFHCLLY